MNKKILVGLMAVAMSGSVFADTATDSHDVTVSVAEVALIDVADADVAFTITAPTEAGSNFTMPSSPSTSSYAITSNVAHTSPGTRAITAAIDGIDPAFVLTANVTAPTTGATVADVVLGTTPADVVTGITNVAQSGIGISYALTLPNTSLVPTHGDHTIAVTYTLGDD